MVTEILAYGFMQRALIAGVLIAVVCAVLGVFVVLRRLSFIGDGLAHIAFAGLALGIFLGVSPFLTALFVSVIAALGMNKLKTSARLSGDATVGILFSTGLAIGAILLSLTRGFKIDLFSYLFGSILSVSASDLLIMASLVVAVFVVIFFMFKELFYATFDEEAARASGMPVEKLNNILLALAGVTIVASMKIVGVLLVSTLMIVPAASALQLGRSFRDTIIASVFFGIISVLIGIFVSYYLDVSTGGTIALAAVLLFLTTMSLRPLLVAGKQF